MLSKVGVILYNSYSGTNLISSYRRKNEELDDKRRKNRLVQDAVSEQIRTLQVSAIDVAYIKIKITV